MLTTNTITSTPGSRMTSKRVGRGAGSGKGTFSGKGAKGQNARSGGGVPDWFEGGQTPLFRRMPKMKGFSNAVFKKHFNILNISDLQILADAGVTLVNREALSQAGMLRKKSLPVKLLASGELKAKIEVHVDAASKGAIAAIEKAGGSITLPAQTVAEK